MVAVWISSVVVIVIIIIHSLIYSIYEANARGERKIKLEALLWNAFCLITISWVSICLGMNLEEEKNKNRPTEQDYKNGKAEMIIKYSNPSDNKPDTTYKFK